MDNTNIELVSNLGVIASTLSSITDLQTLAESVNRIVDSIVEVEYNGFYLVDQETGKLKLYHAKGLSESEKRTAEKTAMNRHPGWVFLNKEVLLISDTQKEKGGKSKDSERSFVVRSRVWLPIMSLDKAVGAFGMASTKVDQFSKQHIALLSFVCNLAGVVFNNITLKNEQEENNKNLTKALDDTKRAKKIKQDFLAKMSHEIRTPMNAILGMTNLLADTNLSEKQGAYSKTLTIASKNLLGLLDDILDFSRLESESYKLENIPINPIDVFKKAYHSFKFKASEKGLDLKYSIGEDVPTFIMGDQLRLGQVILNLLSNAIKFTHTGKIHFSCKLVGIVNKRYRLQFKVADSGVGIKEEKQNLIFQSFQQEDDSTTREFGGSGLGLSIAKEIVGLYGGKIWVESKKNLGSSFFFEIDFDIPKELKAIDLNAQKPTIDDLKNAKILLVEDNEINRFLALAILEKYNAIVEIAENGEIAVEKVKNNNFDLVLMDVQMPIMDGLTASRMIRKEVKSKVPIIALTANAIRGDSNKCFDAGMNDYITKPFEEQDLINKIAYLLPIFKSKFKKVETSNIIPTPSLRTRTNKLYDLSDLKTMANNNPKTLIKLLQVFIDETPAMLKNLQKCYQKNEFEQIFAITHQIKSSIGVISIQDLTKQINEIEKSLKLPEIPDTLEFAIIKLIKKVDLVLSFLKKELSQLRKNIMLTTPNDST
ncbi:MAG: response regulator [Saprospiraceae bacterium]|nr:response regulator [Saprospiraceae bacterium]